ncbi:MAG: AAA family ATPase [Bacteroidales bacterium]|nr:AAA family ATPase [Bacteroidales bacterium]
METRITEDNYREIYESLRIRVSDKFEIPPVVLTVKGSVIGTLGNFSASTGKGKAKKTFNVSAIVAAAISGKKVLEYVPTFPEGKRKVLYFDTEQSEPHCHNVLSRINMLAGFPPDQDCDLLEFSGLRRLSPFDRRRMIEFVLGDHPDAGLVIIDGLRDLLYDINSSSEAQEVIGLLMKWTSEYNIHIHTVLHLNKGDDNVRGHIGTELNHKAETILQIRVNDSDWNISEVRSSFIRDRDFAPFAFKINEVGIPEIAEGVNFDKPEKAESTDYRLLPEELHRKALDKAFGVSEEHPISDPITYSPLLRKMIEAYAEAGFSRQLGVHKNLLKHLVKEGVIQYKDRAYVYNRNFRHVPDPDPESVQSGPEGI